MGVHKWQMLKLNVIAQKVIITINDYILPVFHNISSDKLQRAYFLKRTIVYHASYPIICLNVMLELMIDIQ